MTISETVVSVRCPSCDPESAQGCQWSWELSEDLSLPSETRVIIVTSNG